MCEGVVQQYVVMYEQLFIIFFPVSVYLVMGFKFMVHKLNLARFMSMCAPLGAPFQNQIQNSVQIILKLHARTAAEVQRVS